MMQIVKYFFDMEVIFQRSKKKKNRFDYKSIYVVYIKSSLIMPYNYTTEDFLHNKY